MSFNFTFYKDLNELTNITDSNLSVDKWSSAVLVILIKEKFVLIRRSELVPTHKGQIAFIGGHKLKSESSPIETALREFTEETRLSVECLEIMGISGPVNTSHDKTIIPVIARYKNTEKHFLENAISNGEWDSVILVPIEYLVQSHLWQTAKVKKLNSNSNSSLYRESTILIYFVPLLSSSCEYSFINAKPISLLWGATAKIILNIFHKHLESDK